MEKVNTVLQSAFPQTHTTGITSSTIKEDDPFALMGEQLLYIPESYLSHMISIGEGKPRSHNYWKVLNHSAGQFGCVYKAYLHTGSGSGRSSRIEVAVKTIRRYEQNEMKNFMREMAVMSQLMHPNIIHLHGIVKQRESCN